MTEQESPDESVIEIESLDAEWAEVITRPDGGVEYHRRSLKTRRKKIDAKWVVVGMLVVATAIARPDLLTMAWDTLSRIWPRAG